jgi:outer membrane protein assembly factor BamD
MIAEIGIQCTANSVTFWVWIKKMIKIKYYICGLLVVLACFLTACATTVDPAEAYKDETPEQIFQKGEAALRDKNYTEAIKRFEALDAQYPYGQNTETSQLHIIYAYYMNSDYAAAESAADRFIHAHPTNPHVDYAYYMRGLSNYYQNMGVFERLFAVDFATRDLTQVKKSFNDFDQLQNRYPQSSFAPAAHQYTIYLRDVIANHQIEVAHYYFNREAYVASANRASIVVENYQGTRAVPDALVMMAKSYYQLGLTDQMNQTIAVLNYNYPNSKYMQEVSGKELGRKSFYIVPRKDVIIIPAKKSPMTPPSDYQAYPSYTMNGNRGGVTPVSELVQEARAAGFFVKPQPNSQAVNTQQPVVQQPIAQQPIAQQQVAQQQTAQQHTTQSAAQPAPQAVASANGKRNSPGGIGLGDLLESLSSKAFGTHNKKDDGVGEQQVAQNNAPTTKPTPVMPQQNGMR